MAVRIVVACGSGVATSETVAGKVNKMLKDAKIDAVVEATDLKQVDRALVGAAAYISIVNDKKERDVPTINGIAFLTGVGKDKEFKKLVKAIEEYKEG